MKPRVAIMGLGLMGGSLGLAIRRKRLPYSVVGYARREETRRIAMKRHAVRFAFDDPKDAVAAADIVVFCLPVLTIATVIKDCMPCLKPGCIVTDVGSTKVKILSEVKPLFRGSRASFVGSHPIAGSDETGIEAARADLYEGAVAVVTDECIGEGSLSVKKMKGNVRTVADFWKSLGMKVVVMPAKEHDRMIARTSHLPHLLAAMLVNTVCKGDFNDVARLCGSGFRDTTRVAGGSEDIWHDIVKTNSASVSRGLQDFSKVLDHVKAMIDSGDFDGIRRFLAGSREQRQEFDSLLRRGPTK